MPHHRACVCTFVSLKFTSRNHKRYTEAVQRYFRKSFDVFFLLNGILFVQTSAQQSAMYDSGHKIPSQC